MNDRYNTRTVTRLETKNITLTEDKNYELSLQCRKYVTLPESTDLITVFYEKDSKWHILSEIPVTSQGEWNKTVIQLPVVGNLRLAFEGSPSKGSIVFLDDLLISESQDKTDIRSLFPKTSSVSSIYTITGTKRTAIRKGISIIRKPDGSAMKFISK